MGKKLIPPPQMRLYPWLQKRTDDQIVGDALAKLAVRLSAILTQKGE